MGTKKLLSISILILSLIIIGVTIFFKDNLLFADTEVFLLSSTVKTQYENSYIEVTGFKLEDDIVTISLHSPLGDRSTWEEISLFINSEEYTLKNNVVTEVHGEGSINWITCIGEVNMDDLLYNPNSIYLMTPYGEIEINYIKKHKLYY